MCKLVSVGGRQKLAPRVLGLLCGLPFLPAFSLYQGPLGLVNTPWLWIYVPVFLGLIGWGLVDLAVSRDRFGLFSGALVLLSLPLLTSDYVPQALYPTLALLAALCTVRLLGRHGQEHWLCRGSAVWLGLPLFLALGLWLASGFQVGDFGGQFLHQNYLGGFLVLSLLGLPLLRTVNFSVLRYALGVIFSGLWLSLAYACDSRALLPALGVLALWGLLLKYRRWTRWCGILLGVVALVLGTWFVFREGWFMLGRHDLTRLSWYVGGLGNAFYWMPQGFGTFGVSVFGTLPSIPMSAMVAVQSHSLWVEVLQSYGLGGWVLLGLLLYRGGLWVRVAWRDGRGRWPVGVLLAYAVFATLDSQVDVLPTLFGCVLACGWVECAQRKGGGVSRVSAYRGGVPVLGAVALLSILVLSLPHLVRDLKARSVLWGASPADYTRVLGEVAKHNGDNLAYPYAYGYLLTQQEDAQLRLQGIPYLKHVIQYWPEFGPAYVALGRAQEPLMPLLSIHYYSEALRLMPGHNEALFGLARLCNVKKLRELAFTELVYRHPQYLSWTGAVEYDIQRLSTQKIASEPWQAVRAQWVRLGEFLPSQVPERLDLQKLERSRYVSGAKEDLVQLEQSGWDWQQTRGTWPRHGSRGLMHLVLRNLNLPPLQQQANWEHYPSMYVHWVNWIGIYGTVEGFPARDWYALDAL